MYLDVFRSVEIGHLRGLFTYLMMPFSVNCCRYEIRFCLNYFTQFG